MIAFINGHGGSVHGLKRARAVYTKQRLAQANPICSIFMSFHLFKIIQNC